MKINIPKNTKDTKWTRHSIEKMKQYGLSEQRIRRVLKSPNRVEEGIAENTIAMMQVANPTAKNKTEIWVMIQNFSLRDDSSPSRLDNLSRKIISAWRYPGISPKGRVPEIPDEVWDILSNN